MSIVERLWMLESANEEGEMTDFGPIELLAVGFGSDAEYKGQILNELERLDGKGLIRVLDLLFVGEDSDTGDLVAFDYQGAEYGGLVSALLGFEFTGSAVPDAVTQEHDVEQSFGLSQAEVQDVIRQAPPDFAVGLVLIEHLWARDLKRAIRDAGGVPLADGFLSAEAIAEVVPQLRETVRALDERARADAAVTG